MRFEIVLQRWQNYTNIAPFTEGVSQFRYRLSGAKSRGILINQPSFQTILVTINDNGSK
ncbi:MAG TPA: hypothetical protein VGK59_02365 [Ohtaekwangia sp.]